MEDALRRGGREDGLRLIETMLWDGAALPRWPRHLARLRRSAARLGWPAPPFPEAPRPGTSLSGPFLPAPPFPMPPGPARLRLTLDAGGRVEWRLAALPPAAPVWRLGIAGAVLSPDDPWLSVKSTRRPLHDAARAALAPGLDEVLFVNARGEVCEGTITNVFFDRGAGMRTPPLACGLLPGILREELACPEEVLRPDELGHVRLWVGNALRGLIPARLVTGSGPPRSGPPRSGQSDPDRS